MSTKNSSVVWFSEVGKEDVGLVGGKGANLGEMTQAGIPVPPGFIVTANAYYQFIKENHLEKEIRSLLKHLDVNDSKVLEKTAEKVKRLIIKAHIPKDVVSDITRSYVKLSSMFSDALVAVRSSATAEDLPEASFAGQQVTFLNVKGEANVVTAVQECWASLFEPRAIFYRKQNNFDHFKVGIAVPVQKMVQSEVSGIMFTINPVTNKKTEIVVDAVYGLGETIVQGSVTPDHYVVDKHSLRLLEKEISTQEIQLVRSKDGNKEIRVSKAYQSKQKISDRLIKEIAKLGKKIEKHYYFPQDIEWAVEKNTVYIVQSRPVTTIKSVEKKTEVKKKTTLPKILAGAPASPGIGVGRVVVIHSQKEMDKVKPGDVLVTEMTTPDFVPAMKRAVAIVTNLGGRTCHAAIVSRELGLPCVVGTSKATKKLKTGMVVTVNGTTGEIFKGGTKGPHLTLPYQQKQIKSTAHLKTATKLYVILSQPDLADAVARRDVDGVGLLRAEFMIARIGIHPKKLIKDRKQKLFVNQLVDGLTSFCEAFHPRPVVYRTTDFKTNEYRSLLGGKQFEPEEPNPMLGYRGAFRYMSDPRTFQLELDAIKIVRNKLGLKNLWVMIPFVRTVRELREVKKIIAASGLSRSPSFKLWIMVEIPSNVILLEEFIKVGIDGVSIGTNDLTMLLLGTDRDNEEVAGEYDERDAAVAWALERVIKIAHKYGVTSSICGQAPSEYSEITQLLVKNGITSISVTPDMIEQTRELVYETEKRLARSIQRKP